MHKTPYHSPFRLQSIVTCYRGRQTLDFPWDFVKIEFHSCAIINMISGSVAGRMVQLCRVYVVKAWRYLITLLSLDFLYLFAGN